MQHARRFGAWLAAMALAAAVALATMAALGWAGNPAAPAQQAADIITIDSARFLKSDEVEPPQDDAQPWETRPLPDFWRLHRPNEAGFGWYRASFEVAYQPDTPWAVRVDYANSALAVRVNGVEIAREPVFDAVHLSARASPPHLLTLPASLLQRGRNTLDIHLRAERDINAGLSAVELGPQDAVLPHYLGQRLWRVDLPRALNMASLVAALFMALLGLRRRAESIYPWFCALALVWAVRALYFTGDDRWLTPLRARLGLGGTDVFLAATLSLGLTLLYIVVNRFARRPAPAIERAALALCLVLPLAVAPLGNQVLAPLRPAWYGLAVVLAGLAAFTAARLAWHEQHWRYSLILAGIAFMLATCVHDWGVVAGHLAFTPVPWLGYGPPVMLAAMVVALGGRYFQAFDEAARLNRELEQRVQDKTMELARHYERIAQLERVAAVAGERERLMRDMHDGVGSQLITLLHALDKGRLDPSQAAALVRECVDDLRLVIDSLDVGAQSMGDALANLRFRLEPRLAAAGIATEWVIAEDPVPLSPGVVLQLLRILQEALTNALKHSKASTVRVDWVCDMAGATVSLRVADNGGGMAPPGGRPGRGLDNMRLRAGRIGAILDLQSGPTGTQLVARLPFPHAAPG